MQQITDIKQFLQDISHMKLLTAEEEQSLIKQAQNGDKEARNKLVNSNLRLVVSISKSYSGRGLDISDLIQQGSLGIIHAINKFDLSKQLKFSTYATPWIKMYMGRAIQKQSRTIRIPSHFLTKIKKVNSLKSDWYTYNGQELTIKQIASMTGSKQSQIIRILNSSEQAISLDATINDNDTPVSDLIQDTSLTIDKINDRADEREQLVKALKSELKPREVSVLMLKFGFYGRPYTMAQIGQQLGLTRTRIGQIQREALAKLRDPGVKNKIKECFQ